MMQSNAIGLKSGEVITFSYASQRKKFSRQGCISLIDSITTDAMKPPTLKIAHRFSMATVNGQMLLFNAFQILLNMPFPFCF